MSKLKINSKNERQEILRQYKRLIEVWHTRKDTEDKWLVRKAFRLAADAHKDMRRKSGEPFILHPIAVAIIAANEIGLGKTSIISALLHDTVEDTEMTLEGIRGIFGIDVAKIIDGLTKIDEISVTSSTAQAETIKKILLTLSDDVRVILIKLADRLHNMRTLDSMPLAKQLRVVSETQYIYAPLANRLGLHKIKSELEELSFKYSQEKVYSQIVNEIDKSSQKINQIYEALVNPISEELQKNNFSFEIKLNIKTAHSIWQKMQKQDVSFNDIYNTFSIDIILDADPLNEKLACWSTYSIITGIYRSNSKRLRDWISAPKANGYEAVHATIMNSTGQWVDLHIRSKRMDEIANKGYAAYWKYKELNKIDTSIDNWLQKTRLLLEDNKDDDTFGFITDFKKNLFSDEIFVFTPAGQMINMPSGATVLDFAYTIHTDLGNQCIGANINHRLVPMGHKIKSGDQVEIITSKIQAPIDEWYKYVTTARAKLRIGQAIKSFRKQYKKIGEEKLENYFKQLNIEKTKHNIYLLLTRSKIKGHIDLYYFIAKNLLGIKDIKEIMNPSESRLSWIRNFRLPFTKPRIESNSETTEESVKLPQTVEEKIYISDFNTLEYSVSECCNPLPGDNVMGLIFPDEPIQIHLTNCEVAIRLMSQYGKNIVKAKWKQKAGITFLAGINIKAADSIGLINEITKLITDEFSINIRTFNLKSSEGLANMDITIYVVSTQVLKKLMTRLKKLKSIIKVTRLDKI